MTVSDGVNSAAWDLAFHATSMMLNGGAAGPGRVVGHCLCQNADATDVQIKGKTPVSELVKFEAVTASQIPADEAAWKSDAPAAIVQLRPGHARRLPTRRRRGNFGPPTGHRSPRSGW